MATHFIDSTASGANDGTSATDAWVLYESMPSVATSAGDIVFVSDAHNETLSAADKVFSYATAHTPQNPLRIICVTAASFGSTNIPVSNYGASGVGQVATQGTTNSVEHKDGSIYMWGMRWILGEEDDFVASDEGDVCIFERCFFKQENEFDFFLSGKVSSTGILVDCDIEVFGGDSVINMTNVGISYYFFGGSITVTGTNKKAPLADGTDNLEGQVVVLTGTKITLENGTADQVEVFGGFPAGDGCRFELLNCTLDKIRPLLSATDRDNVHPNTVFRQVNCSTDAGGFEDYQIQTELGFMDRSTAVFRDASNTFDGTNKFSLEFVTDNVGANIEKVTPMRVLLVVLDPGDLNNKTLQIRLITDQGTLTDSEAWVEVYAKADTGSVQQNVTTRALPGAAGTNLTTSGEAASDWTGEPTSSTAQRIDVSFSSKATDGPVYVYFCLATAMVGTTGNQLFVDPTVVVV